MLRVFLLSSISFLKVSDYMRVAIFSDIHGNKYALEEALVKMDEMGIDIHIFCGDAVGYYYYHNEVIDSLRNIKNLYCVLGNHDQMFIDVVNKKKDIKSYVEKYGSSIEKFLNSATQDNLEFLSKMPTELDLIIDGLNIKIIHGSPWNPIDGYVYPDSNFEKYVEIDKDYVFQGHTHYPMRMKQGKCEIVNPGSIGQPRDGGCSSFVVFDTNNKTFEFTSVEYDISKLIQEVQCSGSEPGYLSRVLRRSLGEK